ncbi:MAG: hypothetical protein SFU91_07990 [Chloroherpetonaceae bacterium]|nr:hypothetical protein [Chloroherpetonaceae bacterium]
MNISVKFAVLLFFSVLVQSCVKKPIDISGTVSMEYAGTQISTTKESFVFLLHDSIATPYLNKRRKEFQEELERMKIVQSEIFAKFDSLKSAISNKEVKALHLQLDSIQSSAVEIKKRINEFKHDYVVFTAKELAKKAILTAKTAENGVFGFDQISIGKYVLISIYEEKDHSGFLISTVEFTGKPINVRLENHSIEPVLIYEPEK